MVGQMIADIEELVCSAVEEVFSTMLSKTVEREPREDPNIDGEAQIACSVGFVGELSGVVCIYTTKTHAKSITGLLLGLAPDEEHSDEMVNDAMGEIANMVGGHFKSRLADRGHLCRLSIPSIIRGSNFTIESVSDTMRQVVGFQSDGQHMTVEVILKPTR